MEGEDNRKDAEDGEGAGERGKGRDIRLYFSLLPLRDLCASAVKGLIVPCLNLQSLVGVYVPDAVFCCID